METNRQQDHRILKLVLAAMFAALAFICFSYLRIEIPMGGGMTGKIYIGHTFILLSALFLGAKYGALSGAVGLTLADLLAGYVTSSVPTFFAKFLIGLATAAAAHPLLHINAQREPGRIRRDCILSCAAGSIVNILTEPLIRYFFKVTLFGIEPHVARLSSINCLISMAISAIPSVLLAVFLYCSLRGFVFSRFQLKAD